MPGWDVITGIPGARPVRVEGTFTQIAKLFERSDLPRRLVVLGDVGAGKSALVLRLTLDLLRDRVGADPVPVLLSVASWDPQIDLEDWVAARLSEQYPPLGLRMPEIARPGRTVARVLLARQRVLPILDGLDEMTSDNRKQALRQLSAAVRRKQHLVLTCRTQEYRELMAGLDQEPLEQTPVVELAPVTLIDVRNYLRNTTMPPATRWDRVFDHLKAYPQDVLAEVLSNPLMIWLARMAYQRSSTDPSALIGLATHADRVRQHLLDGLIPAAYAERSGTSRHPARTGPSLEPVCQALTNLAKYLQAHETQNFAWWQVHEEVRGQRIAVTTALATGCVLGSAVGLAVSIKYGQFVGLVSGLVDLLVGGLLCGCTVMIPKAMPRVLDFRFRVSGLHGKLLSKFLGGPAAGLAVGLTFGYACARGGGVLAGVIVFAAVTVAGGLGVGSVFGWVSGVTGGTSAGLSFGLAAALVVHRSSGVAAGLITGAVFAVMGVIWTGLYQPTTITRAISPDSLFRSDRTGSLVVGLTSGVAYGIGYALAIGPWIGVLAAVVLAFAVTITVSSWGQFVVARVWFAIDRKAPFDVMGLLREAHERGIIRQNGVYYQFRHSLLQERLAAKRANVG